MPKKCCVVSCKSGYDTNNEKVSSFKFPNDEQMRLKWLIAIGRKNYKPSKFSVVCEKHFHEEDIIRHCVWVDPETGAKTLHSTRIKLKDKAVPILKLMGTDNNEKKNPEVLNFQNASTSLRRSGRPKKPTAKLQSQNDASSDEDMPLGKLKKLIDPSTRIKNNEPISSLSSAERKITKTLFLALLEKYEKLKERHVTLGQEIDILEKTNIELKCKIFKD